MFYFLFKLDILKTRLFPFTYFWYKRLHREARHLVLYNKQSNLYVDSEWQCMINIYANTDVIPQWNRNTNLMNILVALEKNCIKAHRVIILHHTLLYVLCMYYTASRIHFPSNVFPKRSTLHSQTKYKKKILSQFRK